MILRFEYHILCDDLCAHYRRCGFIADRVGHGLVRIVRPGLENPGEEAREVESQLQVWEALHPEAPVELP
ncbi:MAG: hypothetical protein ACRDL2_14340 [Gaiellaceae bacterium]